MIFSDRTYSALVVSVSEKFNEVLSPILAESGYSPVVYASSVSSAKRKILEKSYDIVIVNAPLPDDFGSGFACDVCTGKNSVCMMIVKNELFDELHSKLAGRGVFLLPKPLNSGMLYRALKWLETARERLRLIDAKTPSLEEKMEEIRLVNRAKWILIESRGMNEEEAHHYIEKQAMDSGTTKREIARRIIDEGEN